MGIGNEIGIETGLHGQGSAIRFVSDSNVGRLARRLRMLGFDSIYPKDAADDELVRIAAREDRILLTRDTYIFHRRPVFNGDIRAVLITRDGIREQLRQVFRALRLAPPFAFLTRCLECNEPLESVERSEVAAEVPPHVFSTQTVFTRCPRCRRIYWAGTHRDHMLSELEEVVREAAAD